MIGRCRVALVAVGSGIDDDLKHALVVGPAVDAAFDDQLPVHFVVIGLETSACRRRARQSRSGSRRVATGRSRSPRARSIARGRRGGSRCACRFPGDRSPFRRRPATARARSASCRPDCETSASYVSAGASGCSADFDPGRAHTRGHHTLAERSTPPAPRPMPRTAQAHGQDPIGLAARKAADDHHHEDRHDAVPQQASHGHGDQRQAGGRGRRQPIVQSRAGTVGDVRVDRHGGKRPIARPFGSNKSICAARWAIMVRRSIDAFHCNAVYSKPPPPMITNEIGISSNRYNQPL